MRKLILLLFITALFALAACGNTEEGAEDNSKEQVSDEKETIVFGQTSWTSAEAPTQIAKQILEEAGFDVEITLLTQPVIFEGLKSGEVDVFMDAWLPYTEAELWDQYKSDLQKVATSYENAPLGWVVPSYVDINSIEELKGNAEKFDGKVYTIGAGAGIVGISEDVMKDYSLDGFELAPSSEPAMMGALDSAIKDEEPIIITGWRPHAMFAKYDLKLLEEPKENFKYDNVYVISYQGLEEKHPEAYDILSKWSIDVDYLEDMMLAYEKDGVSFEDSAKKWIKEHRDQVDKMLGK